MPQEAGCCRIGSFRLCRPHIACVCSFQTISFNEMKGLVIKLITRPLGSSVKPLSSLSSYQSLARVGDMTVLPSRLRYVVCSRVRAGSEPGPPPTVPQYRRCTAGLCAGWRGMMSCAGVGGVGREGHIRQYRMCILSCWR